MKSAVLSITIRDSTDRYFPVAATPMLSRRFFNDGSVAQSQGSRSIPPFGSPGLA